MRDMCKSLENLLACQIDRPRQILAFKPAKPVELAGWLAGWLACLIFKL
ncbi:hypothetical protein CGRA01v4_10641 [Colletotrichum graminicola]|nr:hypothetical protein CGRA01v4_10641 [Colletotrichum graminicola]